MGPRSCRKEVKLEGTACLITAGDRIRVRLAWCDDAAARMQMSVFMPEVQFGAADYWSDQDILWRVRGASQHSALPLNPMPAAQHQPSLRVCAQMHA